MNILINAISITEGGGLIVFIKLLKGMTTLAPTHNWHVAVKSEVVENLPLLPQVTYHNYDWVNRSPLHHLYWYEITLPKLIIKIKADVCFSQTNLLPRRKIQCRTVLLVQNAGFFSSLFEKYYFEQYPSFQQRQIWNNKKKWVLNSILKAEKITVQTHVLADKICNSMKISKDKIVVIPHGPGIIENYNEKVLDSCTLKWRIGYITKFGVQKDFETLIKAVSILIKKGFPIILVLTLNPKLRENQLVLKQLEHYGILEHTENHGEITSIKELHEVYNSLNLFVFTSLCESFGFTLVEALACNLPVLAADTESNREILGNDDCIFPQKNGEALAEKIENLLSDFKKIQALAQFSRYRQKAYSWQSASQAVLNLIE